MPTKKRATGDTYRPTVKILRTKKDVATVVQIGKLRYVLDMSNK